VQTAETGKGDNVAELGRLIRAMSGRVLAKGEVHSVLVVPVAEFGEQALGVPFPRSVAALRAARLIAKVYQADPLTCR
jgi:hypothetical protein